MSTDDGHAGTGHDEAHGDDHPHDGAALGPVDLPNWGAGLLGAALGLVTAAVFAISSGRLG